MYPPFQSRGKGERLPECVHLLVPAFARVRFSPGVVADCLHGMCATVYFSSFS